MWMNRKLQFVLVVIALGALLAGCDSVVSEEPLPESQLTPEELARFEGTWVGGQKDREAITVRFACNGVAELATVRWENGRYRLVKVVMVVAHGRRDGEKSGFLSLSGLDTNGYLVARYQFTTDNDAVLWLPNPKPFEAAIKRGRLMGRVHDKGGAEITAAPEVLLDFLNDPANQSLFLYEEPVVFTKVAAPAKREPIAPCPKQATTKKGFSRESAN